MKWPKAWIGAAIAIALTFPFGTSAGDGIKVTVVITVASQVASPVQIEGFGVSGELRTSWFKSGA